MRRGITPVVAVTLLLMMTVGAAGGAYAWFSQIQTDAQDRAERQLATDLAVKDTICRGSTAYLYVRNTGDADLRGDTVSLYLYRNGGLLGSSRRDMDGAFMNAGGGGWTRVPAETLLTSGATYTVEMAVPAADTEVSARCSAEPVSNWGFEHGPTGNNVDIPGWVATRDWLDHDTGSNHGVTAGTYAYGEEDCCDAYDDGSGQGSGQWDLYQNISGDLGGA
ncbi:MAG: archaellin/type IV pilin N-terminal domain-containing protein, partial [Candidatus Nanohaloarchaea archaeon]